MIKTIALDLEGTLISNAMSQIPRPGLYDFLDECKLVCKRIVIFTTVKEDMFRNIAKLLVSENLAPEWFSNIEYIKWDGKTKNLSFISDNSINEILLVDDFHIYIHPGQESQWLEIKQFDYPYSKTDQELAKILTEIKFRVEGNTVDFS